MSTARRLVAAASALLDAGGEDAVTLRAVAQAVGVSYNAPYKHFKSRNALLAAVVADDFAMLSDAFSSIRQSSEKPMDKFRRALAVFAKYGQEKPARYRLMANNPDIGEHGDVEKAAFATFGEFSALVEECRVAGDLPDVPGPALAGLIFATLHGLINLDANARLRPEKGLNSIGQSMDLLLSLLSPRK
jgi:AcrR family transcriptional regulator